ncbi:MAG: hypothetical protein KAY91_04865, partial [Rhodocyclaceae bacterium]|nr:hypothetical protein [Rhodocyclaceae bacterium]
MSQLRFLGLLNLSITDQTRFALPRSAGKGKGKGKGSLTAGWSARHRPGGRLTSRQNYDHNISNAYSQKQEKHQFMTVHIPLPLASLATINDEDSLRGWVRYELRPVFAHQCCVLSIAMPGENGMESRLVGVDFPAAALRSIISAGGGIDTPVVRRWLQQRRPQLFDADQPWDGTCEVWLGKFRYFEMHNTAAHGDYDAASACTCYFSFLNVPDINAPELEATLLA